MLATEHTYLESKYDPICLRKTKRDFKPAINKACIVQIIKIRRKKSVIIEKCIFFICIKKSRSNKGKQ